MTASTVDPAVLVTEGRTTITRQLEIDGLPVGPQFSGESEWGVEDDEVAHRWMACHHPDCGYSIVSTRLGRCFRRANYAASVRPMRVASAGS
jgi:hypothetical protein